MPTDLDEPKERTEALYAALWRLVTDQGAALAAIGDQPVILNLAAVIGSLPAGDVTTAMAAELAHEEIVAACRDLQDEGLRVEERHLDPGDACLIALGLATGYRGVPLRRRREPAADKLGLVADTAWKERPGVRSHIQNAIYALADQLASREAAYRRRHAAARSEVARPELTALGAEMMRRYEVYYSIYTALSGQRGNTTAFLDLRADGGDGLNRADDYLGLSLFDYADFLSAKERHGREFGGIWLFGEADIEQAMADAIKLIEHFAPLTYRQESLARLRRAEHSEVHSFIESLETDGHGRLALRNWRSRLKECRCDLSAPDPKACKVHALLHACAFWCHTLDVDWYRSVPWHGHPPDNLGVVDVATLYRDLGLSPS